MTTEPETPDGADGQASAPSGLTVLRQGLLAALAGLPASAGTVFDIKPERWTPPCVLLLPADPWLSTREDLPHGVYAASYQVLLVSGPGPNDVVLEQVEQRVDAALDALDAPGHSWLVESVSAPDVVAYEGLGPHLTVRIAVTVPVRLT